MGDGEKGTTWRTHSPLAALGTGQEAPSHFTWEHEARRSQGPQEAIAKPEPEDEAAQAPSCSQLSPSKTLVPLAPSRRPPHPRRRIPGPELPPANESVTPQSSKVCVVTVSIIYLFTRLQFSACLSNSIID